MHQRAAPWRTLHRARPLLLTVSAVRAADSPRIPSALDIALHFCGRLS